jgi:hypothetical protein
MPRHRWRKEPTQVVRAFEQRHSSPNAGALILWAAWSVESLHYLDDVDRASLAPPATGHNPDIVDVAHARWATGTCITALDLCTAALGRVMCKHTGTRELAMSDFDPSLRSSKRRSLLRGSLPALALAWVDAVCSDVEYQDTKEARRCLTHSRLIRHLSVGGPGRQRVDLSLPSGRVNVRIVIERARDVATRHVTAFLDDLPSF